MDSQLKWIVELLKDAGIKHWVDSGTLLGLVRDGKLLEHDRDIDISMWDSDIDKLIGLTDAFRRAGYRIQTWVYAGQLFKLKLYPFSSRKRTIDFNVFCSSNGHAWCPQPVSRNVSGKRAIISTMKKYWWVPWRVVGLSFDLIIRALGKSLPVLNVDRYPWQSVYDIRTWWVPGSMFEFTTYHDQLGVWMPARVDDYLQLRYGNWRVPVHDWLFARDDGGLCHMSPKELDNVLRSPQRSRVQN